MQKSETARTINKVITFVLGAFLILFPLVISGQTTEAYVLPKQVALTIAVLTGLILLGARMLTEGRVVLRRTPFNPIILLLLVVSFLSAIVSMNQADAVTAFVPLLLDVILYFIIINSARTEENFAVLGLCFLVGAAGSSLWTLASYLKIYPLQLALTRTQDFTPFGSAFDQALFLLFALPIAVFFLKGVKSPKAKAISTVCAALIAVGLLVSAYQTFKPINPANKLVILPFETGVQVGLSSISQNPGRVLQGILLGSGYGTFITDFSRFKQPAINQDPNLWFVTFFRSSSFALELLATTGLLGFVAYLIIVVKVVRDATTVKSGGLTLALIIAVVASFVLPFSFTIQTILLLILALYSASRGLVDEKHFFDIELDFVAFKNGLVEAVNPDSTRKRSAKGLPIAFFILILIFGALVGFFSARYVMADTLFQKSLLSAAANKGVDTYNYEVNAIQLFPWRDGFYRIYSQTNLALANSIAAAQRPGSTPDQKTQQTVLTLIQQAITAGRSATTVAPLTYFNWENMSSIYRSLIGFGQNADTFALASEQQAIALNPNDPQVYINLGGIYYQLGKYDDAQRQFQLSVNLKNDYANAHYNLGHSLESKGDLAGALTEYQAVQTLVQGNPTNLGKIAAEISALQAKLGKSQATNNTPPSQAQQPPLGISQPSQVLPTQKPEVKIQSPQ